MQATDCPEHYSAQFSGHSKPLSALEPAGTWSPRKSTQNVPVLDWSDTQMWTLVMHNLDEIVLAQKTGKYGML